MCGYANVRKFSKILKISTSTAIHGGEMNDETMDGLVMSIAEETEVE
jgi:hypothetical protein